MTGIKDVAAKAGVSASTVSNVLNGRADKMSEETQRKVLEAVRELNYLPNKSAQQLKSGRVKMVGVLIPSIMNPNFATLVNFLEKLAKDEYGYQIILGNTNRQEQEEAWFINYMRSSGIKGAIIVSTQTNRRHFKDMIDRGMHLISYDAEQSDGGELLMDSVSLDNFRTGFTAADFLLHQGIEDIVFASIQGDVASRNAKISGFRHALELHGVDSAERVLCLKEVPFYGDSDLPLVAKKTAQLILERFSPLPQAIVAVNDVMAIGIISFLQKNGISVPDEVSVMGIDNIFLSSLTSPSLTTIESPIKEMAAVLLKRLISRIEGRITSAPEEFLFNPRLVCRDSVRLRH